MIDICERCGQEAKILNHHPDYNKPKETIKLCHSCHKIVHSPYSNDIIIGKPSRTPIGVDAHTNEIIRLEAMRQSMKPRCVVTMGDVIRQLAERLNKRHKLVKQ